MKEKKREISEIDRLVSRKLRFRRMQLGVTQSMIAKYINVTVQQVQKYELAINRISSGKLYHIAKFLGVPIGYFFDENEWFVTKEIWSFMTKEVS